MRFDIKPPLLALVAMLGMCFNAIAADATRPLDYTKRNQPYSPADTVTSQKTQPVKNNPLQEKRVDVPTVDLKKSSLKDREAAIDVKEARPKNVREKDSRRPEVIEHTTSAFNHRPSSISTGTDTARPPLVAKYQDSLTAANKIKVGSTTAADRATASKVNRFVFRKNPSEPSSVTQGGTVVPAAGGSVIRK